METQHFLHTSILSTNIWNILLCNVETFINKYMSGIYAFTKSIGHSFCFSEKKNNNKRIYHQFFKNRLNYWDWAFDKI